MNIFFTDQCPLVAAHNLCDAHVVSQFKESIQMLVSAARLNGVPDEYLPLTSKGTVHKGGYKHHPCTRWASERRGNWFWLLRHTFALSKEMRSRFGNHTTILHDQFKTLDDQANEIMARIGGSIGISEPFRAMNQSKGENLDLLSDDLTTVEAYRLFYQRDKRSFAKWEKGVPAPDWF